MYSKDLVWLPEGSEIGEETGARFSESQAGLVGPAGVRPTHDDILVAKLRPGQAIELEAHAVKGGWAGGRAGGARGPAGSLVGGCGG